MSEFDTLITASSLRTLLGNASLRVVDCRFNLMQPELGYRQYCEGHIPGAVYADLDRDLAGPVTPTSGRHPLPVVETFAKTLSRLGISNDTQVVVYDDGNGGLAARLWWLLRWVGHRRVALLDGGLAGWLAEGYDLDDSTTHPAPGQFTARTSAAGVVTTAEVEHLVAGERTGMILVDARDPARFRGEMEPIDPVAGHVPGALNLPFTANIAPDGRWQPADVLRRNWQDCLEDRDPAGVVAMCGSGVTACHLVLSACLAGLPEPRLYAGSWSEWVRESGRPVAAGSG